MKVFSLLLLISVFHFGSGDGPSEIAAFVNKVASSELVKIAKDVADIVGPASAVINFVLDFFIESESARFERYFEEILGKLDDIEVTLERIEESLRNLDAKLSSMSRQLSKDIKFVNFESYLYGIESAVDDFKKNLLTSTDSPKKLLKNLNLFIKNYENKRYEDRLIRSAIGSFIGQQSLVDALIASLIDGEEMSTANYVSSSTMQTVFDFYLAIMDKVSQGDAMMNFCYYWRSKLNEKKSPLRQIRPRSSLTQSFFNSMRSSMGRLEGSKRRSSYINLMNVEEVRLKNVIQYFWQNEYELSRSEETCYYTCEHFKNSYYSANGCYGSVRDCEFKISVFHVEWQYPVSERINSL